jgi:hypothetical protein
LEEQRIRALPAQPSDLRAFITHFAFAERLSVIRLVVPRPEPIAPSRDLSMLGETWDEGLKSVGSHGKLGFDPTVDANVEDIEREGTTGEDLVMEGLEVELGA